MKPSCVGAALVLLTSSAAALRFSGTTRAVSSPLAWSSSSLLPHRCDRRSALSRGLALLSVPTLVPNAASASGGATSGKTTSIPRAKLRYYDRITAVVSRFEAMEAPISSGEAKKAIMAFYGAQYETQDGSMSTAFDEVRASACVAGQASLGKPRSALVSPAEACVAWARDGSL